MMFDSSPAQLGFDSKPIKGCLAIHFDGGCRPTNPGNRYGSFDVELDGERVGGESCFELGWGTNNEAEFESMIRGIEWAGDWLKCSGLDPAFYNVEMFTDSTIVCNRMKRRNRTHKSEAQGRMAALASRAFEKLAEFAAFSIEWNEREKNVERFGH